MIFNNIEEAENYLGNGFFERKDIIVYNGREKNIAVHNCRPLIKFSSKHMYDNLTIYHIETESEVNLAEQMTRLIVSELWK